MNNTIGDNANTITNTIPNDFNSVSQTPVADTPNLVEDLSGMPAVRQSNAPVEEFPQQQASSMDIPAIDNTQPNFDTMQTPQVDNSFQSVPNMMEQVPNTPSVMESTPVQEQFTPSPMSEIDVAKVDSTQPVVQTPSVPMEGVDSQAPSFGGTPVMTESTLPEGLPTDTAIPTVETSSSPVQPTMDTSSNLESLMPQGEQISDISQPQPLSEVPTAPEVSVAEPEAVIPAPLPTVETTPVDIPLENTPVAQPESSPVDLSQPMPEFAPDQQTAMPAFNESEIVNTLGDEKKDGKGGTVVVIVLIVVIVALLAAIGYFFFKIFVT